MTTPSTAQRDQQDATVLRIGREHESPRQQQMTLAGPAVVSGRGLFHGINVRVRLLPAREHTGILFRRVDLPGRPEIAARVENVTSATRRTVLAQNGASVETTEHLLAALAGLQVDNCIVEINAPELPAVDGSALPFCEAILDAGTERQSAERRVFAVRESLAVGGEGGERMEITPLYTGTGCLCYQLDYGTESPVPAGAMTVELTPDVFLQEIAAARTFVLESEIEALRQMGFGSHLTAQDLIVFGTDGSITDNSLRWPNEPVRHKILDAIGDLALCGTAFDGQIIARRSGHKLNHVMASVVSMMSGRGITGRRAA